MDLEHPEKLLHADACLSQHACERADFYLAMKWNHATRRAALQDHVAAFLPGMLETETLERPDDFRTREMR